MHYTTVWLQVRAGSVEEQMGLVLFVLKVSLSLSLSLYLSLSLPPPLSSSPPPSLSLSLPPSLYLSLSPPRTRARAHHLPDSVALLR